MLKNIYAEKNNTFIRCIIIYYYIYLINIAKISEHTLYLSGHLLFTLFLFDKLYNPGFKSYKILLNKFEDPSTHSSQDLMEILDTILQNKLKFSFILLMILVFYNIVLISF